MTPIERGDRVATDVAEWMRENDADGTLRLSTRPLVRLGPLAFKLWPIHRWTIAADGARRGRR